MLLCRPDSTARRPRPALDPTGASLLACAAAGRRSHPPSDNRFDGSLLVRLVGPWDLPNPLLSTQGPGQDALSVLLVLLELPFEDRRRLRSSPESWLCISIENKESKHTSTLVSKTDFQKFAQNVW